MKRALLVLLVLTALAIPTSTLLSQGFQNRSIIFNGTSTRLHSLSSWGGSVGFNPTRITVEAWIKPDNVAADMCIAEDCRDGYLSGWRFYLLGDGRIQLTGSPDGSSDQYFMSAHTVPRNVWTHVAGTFDGDSMKLFINGVRDAAVKALFVSLGANDQILSIGDLNQDGVSTSTFFKGEMDEIRMWSFGRTDAEILRDYNRWLTGNEQFLQLYYHCDEASGDTVRDYGSQGSLFDLSVPYSGTLGHSSPFALTGFPLVPADTSLLQWKGNVGSNVRINGLNFSATPAANTVFFGGMKAAAPTGGTTSYLNVPVPPGANFGPVTVTTNGLTGYSPRQFTPTYNGIGNISGGSFELQGTVGAGTGPQRVAIADIDGDGKSDVIVGGTNAQSCYRNLSTSKNLILEGPVTAFANQPTNGAIADFDGDGKLDMAYGRATEVYIDVLRNTSTPGSISFSSFTPTLGFAYATSIATTDFDGDGKPDIVAGVSPWGTLRILRNASTIGAISFSEAFTPSNASGNFVAAGDIDGDQKPEIVFTNQGGDYITILHNGGTLGGIRFDSTWVVSMPAGGSPTTSFIADFNMDGISDIAIICPGTDEVQLLMNNGSSNPRNFLRTSRPFVGLGTPTELALGDVDGDGLVDLLVGSSVDPVVAYRNTSTAGALSFADGVDLQTGNTQNSLALGDLNNDGRPDLVTLNNGNASLSLLRNTPLGTPGNFSASDNQTSSINLGWDDRADGETGYVIYRDGVQVQSLGADAVNWEDNSNSLRQGRIYKYDVTATNSAKGIRSDTVSDYGRLQFKGEITGKVTTQNGVGGNGAGISGATVGIARTSPNRYHSLSFDGIDDYVLVPASSSFDIWAGTIECWVRPEWTAPLAANPVIIASGNYPSRYAIRMGANRDHISFFGNFFGFAFDYPIPYSFETDHWYHVAVTTNGYSVAVYVNGEAIGGAGFYSVYQTAGAPLVRGGFTDGARFQGNIDEVRLWNTVRDAASIKASMNSYVGSGTSGLVGYWRFDEGSGTTVGDNGETSTHYGFLQNGVAWTNESSPARPSAVTDAQGNYALEQVDYGDTTTTCYLAATRGTDVIHPDTLTMQFTRNSYVFSDQNFIDTSTFAFSGKVSVKDYPGLGMKGVRLLVDGFAIDSTGTGGLFSVGLTADQHTIKPVFHGHHFSPESLRVRIQNDTSGVVFEDITRDTIRGIVAAGTCKYPMGSATLRLIETTSGSASYDTSFATGPSGQFVAIVPAISYTLFVSDLQSKDADALAYFSSAQRNVSVVEQDPAALADTLLYPPGVDRKYVELIYRSKPTLTIQGIPAAGDCPMIVVRQGKRIPVKIKVTEVYGSRPPCIVDSGTVDVSDGVGDKEVPVNLRIANGLATYNIVAGQPNIIAGGDHPYAKLFEVQTTQPGGAATADFWMVVLGTKSRGKTSTTVTPQLPFLVLHDPPGDNSFSYMKRESTYCFDWSFSERKENSVSGWVSVRAGVGLAQNIPDVNGIGFYVDLTAGAGYEGSLLDTSYHYTSCVHTTDVIQTSDDEALVGQPGDVYVTISLVISYGVSDILGFEQRSCQPVLTRRLTFDRVAYNNLVAYTDYYIRRREIPRLNSLIAYWQQHLNPDSVRLFEDTRRQWERILEDDEQARAQSIGSPFFGRDSVTYSGGVPLSREWETSGERSSHYQVDLNVDEHAALSAGLIGEFDVQHLEGGVDQEFRWERTWDTTKTTTTSRAFGYTMYDDDPLDRIHLNVRQSPKDASPVFVLLDGETQCPWEPRTQRRQLAKLTLSPPINNGVAPESTVAITAQCANMSESGDTVTYRLENPYAATDSIPYMYIGDTPFIGLSAPIKVPPGQFRNLYVAVKKAPQWANYNNVRLVLSTECDPLHVSDTASFSIHFEDGVDSPPEVLTKNAVAQKNDPSTIELKALDPEGGQVTFQLIEEPRHGRFTDDTPPTLTYLPDPGFVGSDRFLINASDGVNTVPQRFDITVINTSPVVARARIDTTASEDAMITFHLSASDLNGDALKDTILYPPAHGRLSGPLSDLVYQADSNYDGQDDFTCGFFDGQVVARATVGITLRAVYDPPAIHDDVCALTGTEGNVTVNVLKNDRVDGDRSLTLIDSVVHGSAGYAINNGDGTLSYYDTTFSNTRPGAKAGESVSSANGVYVDHLTYHVTDGVDTVQAQLQVDVDRANHRPVAGLGSALEFDGANDGVVTDFAIYHRAEITIEYWFKGEVAQSIVREQPNDAIYVVSGWNGMHILSNDDGVNGLPTGDITDGKWHHVAMTWKLSTVNGFRSYRDGVLVAARTSSDQPIPDLVVASPLTIGYAKIYNSEFMKGTLDEVRIWNTARTDSEIQAGMYATYPPGTPGLDACWHFDENSGPVTYSSVPSPFGQTASLQNMTNPWKLTGVLPKVSVWEDDSTLITLPAYDADGDPLTYTIIGQPAHGKLLTIGATPMYLPDHDYTGYDYVTFSVNDGKAESSVPASLSINVLNKQDPPIAKTSLFETPKNVKVFIRLFASDPDPGDVLQYIVGTPHNGSLAPADTFPNEFFYQPVHGYAGADSFVYRVTDGIDTSSAVIPIMVTNSRPVAVDTLLAQASGTVFTTILHATDSDGDTLTYGILATPSHGTLVADSLPKITFTPQAGLSGKDTVLYSVSDGSEVDTGSVVFTILVPTAVKNDAPPLPKAFELC
ncbi:MAG TPA: LamG-like jellyroll fold domain-containing protein, partial [Bacteroidota bacterium]|nr:LamG-like jellyroll fold domain-containing protein [Bacteroidota bacterium]